MTETPARIQRACDLFTQNVILDSELAWLVVHAVLDGNLGNLNELNCSMPAGVCDAMLAVISHIESHDYVDPNPFVRDGLSDTQKRQRADRLMKTYKFVFAQIRQHFDATTQG